MGILNPMQYPLRTNEQQVDVCYDFVAILMYSRVGEGCLRLGFDI